MEFLESKSNSTTLVVSLLTERSFDTILLYHHCKWRVPVPGVFPYRLLCHTWGRSIDGDESSCDSKKQYQYVRSRKHSNSSWEYDLRTTINYYIGVKLGKHYTLPDPTFPHLFVTRIASFLLLLLTQDRRRRRRTKSKRS